jgi:hypothetical protein
MPVNPVKRRIDGMRMFSPSRGDEDFHPDFVQANRGCTGVKRMSEEEKQRILDWVKQQKKTKHYFNDLCKAVPEIKMMAAKKIINELVAEGKLKYWSSGSTTMYQLPSEGDVDKEEKGMN